jgi:hypothetical protein
MLLQGLGWNDLPVPAPENDWMASGLTPLVALVALGIFVATVAAMIAIALQHGPRIRRRGGTI